MRYQFAIGMLATLAITGNVYAVDISVCPKVSDIKSQPYTDPALPTPYGQGFKYTATASGKTWTGETSGTKDDYLAAKYGLEVETFGEVNGKLLCDYGGKRLVENGEVSDPNLRLSAPK